jgi:adenylate kinase family enzyme
MARIHILGASGAGTTTLGAELAARIGLLHVDADTLFWIPTDPPFTTRRPEDDRRALLLQRLPVMGHWVFSGSALKWGTPLEPFYDLIVFLRLDPTMRIQRLRQREIARYGARIEAGGDMVRASVEFLEWAASYDTGGREGRSLAAHGTWLKSQRAHVLRLDSSAPVPDLVTAVMAQLEHG